MPSAPVYEEKFFKAPPLYKKMTPKPESKTIIPKMDAHTMTPTNQRSKKIMTKERTTESPTPAKIYR